MSGDFLRKIGLAGRRRPRPQRIDPFSVGEPWRGFVQNAVSARGRFLNAVDRTQPGPLQDTLRTLANRLDIGVDQCWRIACYADSLARARSDIKALQAENGMVDRMDQVIEDTRGNLRLLDARLKESVARVIELIAWVGFDDPHHHGAAGGGRAGLSAPASLPNEPVAGIDGVVSELEALRQALEETHQGALDPPKSP